MSDPRFAHSFWFNYKTIYQSDGTTPCGECGLPEAEHKEPRGFSHATVQVLAVYTEAVTKLHEAIDRAWCGGIYGTDTVWDERAYNAARAAVRAARMLTVKDEYR